MKITRWEWLVLGLVLVLGAGLRFGWVGVNSFAGDEARISLDALRMARGGEFVLAGQPSSVNIPFFPASVWLFALPYALSPDPLLATQFVSLLSLLTIAGTWLLARRWGALPALIAALYLAASPYAVFYGRNIWQPNLLPFLALLWGWGAYLGAGASDRRRAFGIALNLFLGAFIFQVHFAGIAVALGSAYCFVRWRWWRAPLPVVIGAALALLAALPYVYFITTVAPDVAGRYGDVLGGGESQFSLTALGHLLTMSVGWDWAYLGAGESDTLSRGLTTVIGAGLLLIAGLIGLLRLRFAAQQSDASASTSAALAEITLIWLLVSPIFFVRHSTPVLPHYLLVALPAIALAAGASARLLRGRHWPLIPLTLAALLAAVWSFQINIVLGEASQTRPANSALSSILNESRGAALGVAADQPVLFFTHGDDPAIDGEVAVFGALLWERDHRILNGDVLLILPPHPATLLATLAPFQAWEELEAAGLAGEAQSFPRRDGAPPYMAAAYDGVSEPAGFTPIEPAAFADGTQLEGWRARRVGPRLRISTLWRVTDSPPAQTTQQFHHLRDAAALDGEPLAVSDVPLSLHTWQVGDRVIVMADFFEIDAGEYWIDAGHYTLPDVTRVPRADGSDSIRLGPFTLD